MTPRKFLQTTVSAAVVIACAWPAAAAQDERRVALSIAFPGEAGILWQASERVAVRTDFGFSWSKHESSFGSDYGVVTSESSSRSLGAGLSILFTVARWDRLRAYVVPRVSYTDLSGANGAVVGVIGVSGDITGGMVPEDRDTRRGRAVELSGSFGVEYALAERFGVYGETGVAFATVRYSSHSAGDESRTRAVGSRNAIGVLFRF